MNEHVLNHQEGKNYFNSNIIKNKNICLLQSFLMDSLEGDVARS